MKNIAETFINAKTYEERMPLSHTGKLSFQLKKGKEWASISVSKTIWKKRTDRHLIVPDLWTSPDHPPHISAFSKEEVVSLSPEFIKKWDGADISFKFSDNVRIVDPDNWDEVYELAFEPVDMLEFEYLRMGNGFTPKMYGNHEFHMTLGLKLLKDKKKRESRKI